MYILSRRVLKFNTNHFVLFLGVLYAVDGKDMFVAGKSVNGFILDPDAGSLVNTFKPSDKVCHPSS